MCYRVGCSWQSIWDLWDLNEIKTNVKKLLASCCRADTVHGKRLSSCQLSPTYLSSTLSSMVASAKAKKSSIQTNLCFVFRVWNIAPIFVCFFVILNLKIMGNGHAWTISTGACKGLNPTSLFSVALRHLENAATKLERKLHRWLEGIEMGGKRKTDFFLLDFPFLWGFGIDPEWEKSLEVKQ